MPPCLLLLAEAVTDSEIINHALIQLAGSGGLGALVVFLGNTIKTKLEAINNTDIALGKRIDALDTDIKSLGGRLDSLQAEIARKANTDSVALLEKRLEMLEKRLETHEREARERSGRLARVEAKTELGPGSSGVAWAKPDVPEPR